MTEEAASPVAATAPAAPDDDDRPNVSSDNTSAAVVDTSYSRQRRGRRATYGSSSSSGAAADGDAAKPSAAEGAEVADSLGHLDGAAAAAAANSNNGRSAGGDHDASCVPEAGPPSPTAAIASGGVSQEGLDFGMDSDADNDDDDDDVDANDTSTDIVSNDDDDDSEDEEMDHDDKDVPAASGRRRKKKSYAPKSTRVSFANEEGEEGNDDDNENDAEEDSEALVLDATQPEEEMAEDEETDGASPVAKAPRSILKKVKEPEAEPEKEEDEEEEMLLEEEEKEVDEQPPSPKKAKKKTSKAKAKRSSSKQKKASKANEEEDTVAAAASDENEQLLRAVEEVYAVADKETMTIGDLCRSVEKRANITIDKALKKIVKAHVTDLVSGSVKTYAEKDAEEEEAASATASEEEEENGSDDSESSSDEEDFLEKEDAKPKKAKSKSKSKSKGKGKAERSDDNDEIGGQADSEQEEEEVSEDESIPDADNSSDYEEEPEPAPQKKKSKKSAKKKSKKGSAVETPTKQSAGGRVRGGMKTRSNSSKKKKNRRNAPHVRIHAEMVRKRQLEEQRKRAEALSKEAEAEREAQTAADRKRAEAIARKFQTDSEESRIQRRRDRVGLLGKLQARRFDLIKTSDCLVDTGDDNVTLRSFGHKKAKAHAEAGEAAVAALVPRLTASSATNISEELDSDNVKEAALPVDESNESEQKEEEKKSTRIKRANVIDDSSSDEDSDDNEEEEGSDDDIELEIIGAAPSAASSAELKAPSPSKASSALDIINGAKKKVSRAAPKRKKNVAPGRATLRNALRAKQVQAGNKWLARELGYKTEQEHIRDCQLMEQRKQKQMLRIEAERTKIQQRRQEMLANGDDEALEKSEAKPLDELTAKDSGDLLGLAREEEEDEELAMARAIEEEQKDEEEQPGAANNGDESPMDNDDDDGDFPPLNDDESDKLDEEVALPTTSDDTAEGPKGDGMAEFATPTEGDGAEVVTSELAVAVSPSSDQGDAFEGDADDDATVDRGNDLDDDDATVDKGAPVVREHGEVPGSIGVAAEGDAAPAAAATAVTTDEAQLESKPDEGTGSDEEVEFDVSTKDLASKEEEEEGVSDKPKKPKNSAWQAMLKKEAELLKKQKGKKGNGMLEMEADEEEDEEGVAGLEDFGFAIQADQKKDDDDEGADDVDQDDLDNVVDDLSDNEGDEEAGEAARREAAAREERERHKEIMRRMREGYDGRRGGVAGGGTARGNLRFDQLVAADNREDAKRLGLLNEDEFDSDNEGGEGGKKEGDGEIEDETALLDQMLKDRFLQRDKEEELEENFSDDEDEEDGNEEGGGDAGSDAEEDREQERLAKRFAKRARMQRLLENHGGDQEFSQARLIDEDETMQKDLKTMKNALSRKRRQTSSSSNLGSSSRLGSTDSDSQDIGAKKQRRRGSGSGDEITTKTSSSSQRSAFANCGSLSIALQSNRTTAKRKSSFLSNGKNSALGRSSSATVSKSVSLSHVLFQTGEASQISQLPRSTSLGNSSLSRGGSSRSGFGPSSNKRAKTGSGSQSLWSAVTANSFQKRAQ